MSTHNGNRRSVARGFWGGWGRSAARVGLTILPLACLGCRVATTAGAPSPKAADLEEPLARWRALHDQAAVAAYVRHGDDVRCGEADAPPMVGVDAARFEVLGETGYARDPSGVYYPIRQICIDGEDFGYCTCSEYRVVDAVAQDFRYLGRDYATDGRRVYFRGEVVPRADAISARVILGPEYLYCLVDARGVYILKQRLEGADPQSFGFWRAVDGAYLLRDDRHTWRLEPGSPPTIGRVP